MNTYGLGTCDQCGNYNGMCANPECGIVTCHDRCPRCSRRVKTPYELAWSHVRGATAAERALLLFQDHLVQIHSGNFTQAFGMLHRACTLMGVGDKPTWKKPPLPTVRLDNLRGRSAAFFDDLLAFVVSAAHFGDIDQLCAALETAAREADNAHEADFFRAAKRFLEQEDEQCR